MGLMRDYCLQADLYNCSHAVTYLFNLSLDSIALTVNKSLLPAATRLGKLVSVGGG